ncbi:hypothetical protein [Kribbella sp. NPDC006257]|uniref:LptM family lipoprotein n=1 Tax=Kribbella sp. NPDC006257 TaxID=3156738 RepID=UPI0033BB211F
MRIRRLVLAAVVSAGLAACGNSAPSLPSADNSTKPPASPVARSLPDHFPAIKSEGDAGNYLETMVKIMAKSLKSPRSYEKEPKTIAVTETRDCITGGTMIGDKALSYGGMPVPAIGACPEDGHKGSKLVILYGPKAVWAYVQENGQANPDQSMWTWVYIEYLIESRRADEARTGKHADALSYENVPACVRGRLNGGLLRAGYISTTDVNRGAVLDGEWGTIFKNARDNGKC